jgi:hypothetical protein
MKTEFNKKILLKYVPIYDANLSLASGVTLSDAEITEGYEYCTLLEKEWDTVAHVLEYYVSLGFKLPNQTPAYLTHPRGTFTPFSDPLTLHIKTDTSDVLATLIHEYCHILFLYHENDAIADKIWNAVQNAFPTEDFETQDHIIINKLTEAGLYYLWGKEKADAILLKERTLPGLEQAWKILNSAELKNTDPIEAILELCAQQSGK